jgi:PKD repeat protein
MYGEQLLKQFSKFVFVYLFIAAGLLNNAALAQAPVASFSVQQSSGCIPFSVLFTNNSTNATSWYWDFGNGNYSTLQNPTNVYLNPGSFSVKLIAYNSSGQADSVTQTGIVYTVSPPIVNFTSSSTVACLESSTIIFNNQSSNFNTCLWDFGDGNTSTSMNPSHIYNSPGTYTVTLIAYNSQFGCTSSLSKTGYIQILDNPAASFTANITALCNPQTPVLFQAQASSAVNFIWHFGDGTTSTQPSPSHIYGQAGLYDVTLITINQLGCTDTVVQSAYIEVLDNPVPVINSTEPLNGCAPLTTIFSSGTNNVISSSWDFGDGTLSQLSTPYHTFVGAGSYTVSVTLIYTNGCANTNTTIVNGFAKPTVNYSTSGAQGCAPVTPVFTNLTSGAGNSYLWDFGDGTTSTQFNPVHVYNVTGSFTPTLTVTDINGCSNSFYNFVPVVVTSASALFTADNLTGCNPHTVNFSHLGGGLFTYNWNFGDGTTSSQQSPTHIYTVNGNYSVTLTVTNSTGCTHTYVYPQQVHVSTGANNFSPAPPVTSCAPFTVNLFDNSPGTSSWLWDFGDGTTSTLQNPVHTYTTSGTFVVSLTTQSSGSNCSQFISPFATYIINAGEPDFAVTQSLCPPFTATFTDYSINAVAWFWDFGDGTTSTAQHPVHVYTQPGSYNVSLTITTSQGCSFTMYHNYAVTFIPLSAHATATSTDSILPITANFFANSSGATMWLWDFGDGTTSTLMNPVHIYTTPGPYNISLTISNPQCTYTYDYPAITFGSGAVLPGGGSDSTHVPDPVYSCIPYEMNFTNPVQNTVSWLWDFGDGVTSTLENPSHVYVDPGTYYVILITWDSFGNTDTVERATPFYLTGATADFNITYSNNCQGSTVSLQNNSINGVTYLWDFGDGTTSTNFSPVHTYNTTGVNYIVSLTVTDSLGCTDFMARSYYAAVVQPLSASTRRGCSGDTIHFSSGYINYNSFSWNFGDGTNSTDPNPVHVYADSGSFQVSLTVTDSLGCVTSWNLPYLISIRKPIANFTSTLVFGGCMRVQHQFNNLSSGADSYIWDFGDGTYSSQINPLHNYVVPGNYSVTLTAVAEGCSNSFTINNLVYFPNLIADFNSVQSSDCYPVTVSYTDNSTDAVSWLWEFGDGTSSTLQNPVHTFTSKPTGSVALTVTSYVGCPKTIVKPNIAAMNINLSVTDSVGCSPFLFSVIDSSENVASYLWNFGDGTTSTAASPTHLFQANGSFAVTLTATSTSGCTEVINPVAVVKSSGPAANFAMNAIYSCAPTIVNFTDFSTGADQWNWDFGNTNHSVLPSPVHIYNTPGTYDVTLVVSDSVGCSDTLFLPELVHITGSIANFSVTGTSGCSPWDVQFSDSSISAFSWLWNFGDGNISSVQNPVHTFDTPGSYMVTLITQDTTGCQSVYSNPVPLNVQLPPQAAFNVTATTGCAPFQASINNTSTGGISYLWDFGNGTTSTTVNPSPVFNTPGVYFITLIAMNAQGCSDTLISETPIVVGTIPQPSFTINNNSGCSPWVAQFVNTSMSADSTTIYLWSFGDGTVSNQVAPIHIYNTPGIYTVTLTMTNNFVCSETYTLANSVIVTDGTPPPPVMLKSASVVDDVSIDVTWGNLPASGLQAYNLYRYNPSLTAFELIYTDVNPSNTSLNVTSNYVDGNVLTADQTYMYVVQAVNHCNAATPLSQLTPHTSINLKTQIANNIANLSWNFYDGCSVGHYNVYRQDDQQGVFNQIGVVDASMNSYLDTTVYCGMNAMYRICAVDLCGEGFTAWSDIEEITVPGILANQKVDMVRSTVMDDSYVFTEWAPPAISPQLLTSIELYRSTDNVNYTLIATLPPTETNYSDFDTKVHEQFYFYRVKVTNVCELETSQGLESSSILLIGGVDDENRSQLRWSPYKKWDTGVDYYVIEKLDEFGVWQTIRIVDGNVLEYLDR